MTALPEPPPTDHSGLRVLDLTQCLDLLRSVPVGRFAFDLDGELSVLPVAHVVDHLDVCFRTAGDSKIGAAADHERVAFEADAYDARTRTGWSVLVQGTAEIVHDVAATERLEALTPQWWLPPADRPRRWVRVRAASVTGRSLG